MQGCVILNECQWGLGKEHASVHGQALKHVGYLDFAGGLKALKIALSVLCADALSQIVHVLLFFSAKSAFP